MTALVPSLVPLAAAEAGVNVAEMNGMAYIMGYVVNTHGWIVELLRVIPAVGQLFVPMVGRAT